MATHSNRYDERDEQTKHDEQDGQDGQKVRLDLHPRMPSDFGSVNDRAINDKAAKELARAVYAELRSEGCRAGDMISVSSLLISLITAEIRHSD